MYSVSTHIQAQPTILTVGNVKGGVDKTTLTVNIAIARALAGGDVLLVDSDEQGTVLHIWGRERSPPPATPRSTDKHPADPEKAAEAFIAGAGGASEQADVRKTPVMIRFDRDLLARVDAAAKRRGISRSGWVRYKVLPRSTPGKGKGKRHADQAGAA